MPTRFISFGNQQLLDLYGALSMYINKYIVGINRTENSVLKALFTELTQEFTNRGLTLPTTKSF